MTIVIVGSLVCYTILGLLFVWGLCRNGARGEARARAAWRAWKEGR